MASYSRDFKVNALKISDEIGVRDAAKRLGMPYGTLVKWRRTANRPKLDAYSESLRKQENLESLQKEVQELKRTNSILLETIKCLTSARV